MKLETSENSENSISEAAASFTLNSRDNTPLTYMKAGCGPVIVLANAYGVQPRLWDGVIKALTPDYTVIIWELRGIENADKPNPDFEFTVTEHARDLNEILQAEQIESAHCVAWCSGAKVALEYQHNFPGKLKSISFVSGNFTPFAPQLHCQSEWDEKMLAATSLLLQNPAAAPFFHDAIKTAIDAAMRGDTNIQGGRFGLLKMIRPEYISLMLAPMFNESTMVNYLAMINAYYRYDVSPLLAGLSIPLCFVWAEGDHISQPEQSRILSAQLPNSRAIPVADANHYMVIEKPELIANHIAEFISGLE